MRPPVRMSTVAKSSASHSGCHGNGRVAAGLMVAYTSRTEENGGGESIVGNEEGHSIQDSVLAVLRRKLGPYVAPRTSTEQKLAEIWCDVLGVDRVGITDSYEDLGVDSLLAASIFVEIEETFAISIVTTALLDAPTIEQLARKIDELVSKRLT